LIDSSYARDLSFKRKAVWKELDFVGGVDLAFIAGGIHFSDYTSIGLETDILG
jgi:hypothetical protein